ncbi:tyrosine-type recombinase/integrase [Actinoplanes sp. CA-054009]
MASIEYRKSGPRVVWRLNRPGHPEHGRKQPMECGDEELALRAKGIVEDHGHQLTREEAEELILGPVERPDTAVLTFAEWCEQWLAGKSRISPRTQRDYRQMLDYRILPGPDEIEPPARVVADFGRRPIGSFVPNDITRYINALRAEGLSSTTIDKQYAVISMAFASAVKNKIIDENPCDGTDFVRGQVDHDDTGEEQHVYLTPDEWQILYGSFNEKDRDFVECLVGTADRFGEATALQVRDLVQPTARDPFPRLQTRRAWKRGDDGRFYLGTTKGRQRRKNRVDDELFEMLLRNCEGKAPEDFIFPGPNGGQMDYQNFLSRIWNPAVTRAMRCPIHPPASQASYLETPSGVCGDHGGRNANGRPCGRSLVANYDRCMHHLGPTRDAVSSCDCPDVLHRRPSPHDLRHTCAAWMLADPTVAPLYVSRYLGHASMEVTDKVYAGLVPSGEGAAVVAIAKARGRDRGTAPLLQAA